MTKLLSVVVDKVPYQTTYVYDEEAKNRSAAIYENPNNPFSEAVRQALIAKILELENKTIGANAQVCLRFPGKISIIPQSPP